MVTWSHFNW